MAMNVRMANTTTLYIKQQENSTILYIYSCLMGCYQYKEITIIFTINNLKSFRYLIFLFIIPSFRSIC